MIQEKNNYKNPTHQRNQRLLMGPGNLVVFKIKIADDLLISYFIFRKNFD